MLDYPLEAFQKIFDEHTASNSLHNNLIELIDCLYKDLEVSKNEVVNLQQQMQNLLKQETFGITSKYVALKEVNVTLKNQLIALKNENDCLNTQMIAKDEEIKKSLSEKQQEMEIYYMNQIKQKEEQIKQKDDELQIAKLNHQKKQQQLYQEMEAAGAFSAMQLDQTESNFRKQISDLNKKLKDSMDTCTILRTELFSTKEQCNAYKNRITELQKQYRESQNLELSFKSNDKSLNNYNANSSVLSEKCNNSFNSKYQPLEINYKNISNSQNTSPVFRKPAVYRGSPQFLVGPSKKINKGVLPSLIKLNDKKRNDKEDKVLVKKRKLYNPNDFTYLNINEREETESPDQI
ncbi:structural maintenance of chromosomes protein 2-like [Asbolus verrucosus]|uniref:Structural maintenance of chromosomes protein 2-like n=1 Tax=Asbolus verrucosus TaxID=1661398 RepID=A0A482VVJ7_ASBVE|nr:structural maintenance of chromosomes protein 2-like [Asbolus verrucosus]